jgi:hypothetical protein
MTDLKALVHQKFGVDDTQHRYLNTAIIGAVISRYKNNEPLLGSLTYEERLSEGSDEGLNKAVQIVSALVWVQNYIREKEMPYKSISEYIQLVKDSLEEYENGV